MTFLKTKIKNLNNRIINYSNILVNFLSNGPNITSIHGPTEKASPIIDINHMMLTKLNIP